MKGWTTSANHTVVETGAVMGLLRSLQRVRQPVRWGLVIAMTCGSVALDRATGPDTSMLLAYTLAVAAAAWLLPDWVAMIVATVASVATAWVRLAPADHPTADSIIVLNAAFRLGSLMLFAVVVSALGTYIAAAERAASTDPLTGIHNRGAAVDRLRTELERSVRRSEPLSVVYFDLDGLKRVNDRDGHAAGDVLINTFADAVQRFTRSTDTFGRVGGDEFVLICPGTDRNATTLLITRLFADSTVPAASFGIATRDDDDDATTLLGRADRAMYEFKSHRD